MLWQRFGDNFPHNVLSLRPTRGSWETSSRCAPVSPDSSTRTCGPSLPPWWRTVEWWLLPLWVSRLAPCTSCFPLYTLLHLWPSSGSRTPSCLSRHNRFRPRAGNRSFSRLHSGLIFGVFANQFLSLTSISLMARLVNESIRRKELYFHKWAPHVKQLLTECIQCVRGAFNRCVDFESLPLF